MEHDEKNVSEEGLRLLERLLARMAKDDNGCWVWSGARSADGYGAISVHGKVMYVHRVAAALFHVLDGQDGLCVLHTCDNPSCFNPDHLWLGTRGDNVRDCARKGRIKRKLDEADVIEIRRLVKDGGRTHKSIGEQFGVSKETVGQISRGETWKHLLDHESEAAAPVFTNEEDLASAA